MPKYVTEGGSEVHGVMGEFADPASLTHAAEKVRDAGYEKWDAFAPFPVHGLDEAMGVKRTRLPLIVAVVAVLGVSCAVLLQWWVTSVAYPLVVQGKPYDAWEPWLPVTFELGVLFSSFATLISMLAMNVLPRWNHPLLKNERFLRVSNDRFVICVEAADPRFDPRGTRDLLTSLGAMNVAVVEE